MADMETWAEEYAYALTARAHDVGQELKQEAEPNPMRAAIPLIELSGICRMLAVWKLLQAGEYNPSDEAVEAGARAYATQFEQRLKEERG